MSGRVIVVGSVNVDLVASVPTAAGRRARRWAAPPSRSTMAARAATRPSRRRGSARRRPSSARSGTMRSGSAREPRSRRAAWIYSAAGRASGRADRCRADPRPARWRERHRRRARRQRDGRAPRRSRRRWRRRGCVRRCRARQPRDPDGGGAERRWPLAAPRVRQRSSTRRRRSGSTAACSGSRTS